MIQYAKILLSEVALGLSLILASSTIVQAASKGFNYQIGNCFSSIDNAVNTASRGGANNYSYRFGALAPIMQTACRLDARWISRQDEQVSYCNYVTQRVRQAAEVGGPGNYSYRLNAMNPVINAACGG